MKILKNLILATLLFVSSATYADAVTFTASAPNAVPNGQAFQLVYTINASAKELRIPEIADFDILAGPFQSKSSETQFINGKMSSSTTLRFTYTLLPQKEGTFTIPAATIMADKQKYSSNQLTIKVLPPDEEPSQSSNSQTGQSVPSQSITNDNLFIRTILSRTNVFEQEYILVTYKIYSRVDLVNITNVKFPDFKGFLMQEIELPKDKQFALENYNGKNYNTITLRQLLLYPQHSGTLNVDKMTCDAIIRVRNASRSRSIFDDFFDTYQEVQKTLSSPGAKIEVKALPFGKPESFSGAVGDFKITSSINKTDLQANESVTIKLKITGNGNIKLIKNPDVKFPGDFEIYEPKVENDFTNTASGVSGTKSIEYLAIPRHGGDFTIPAVRFSYFDVKSKSYKTLSTSEYQLHVDKAAVPDSESESVVNNFSNKESVQFLGKDIRHIYMDKMNVAPSPDFFFGTVGFVLSYLLPLALIVFIFWFFRKQAKENADISLVRNKRANKVARKRLRLAEKYLREQNKELFYNEVLKAMWGYLCDKLNIPQALLNKDNVEQELRKYELDESLISGFMNILNECEFAQYSPSESSEDRNNLYAETIRLIMRMEECIKK